MNNMASMIDHTLLKPEATFEQVQKLAQEAKANEFASVCVNPAMVEEAFSILKGTSVKVCTVIGFPLGASTPETKAAEAEQAMKQGAAELDMVINIGALKSGRDEVVLRDIQSVVQTADKTALVKVIIETSLLTEDEKRRACELALEAGADFVKTSTGFAGGGATVEDVTLMKSIVGEKAQVKASGGIRDLKTAEAMINAGASRLGTSSGIALVSGNQAEEGSY